MQVAALGKEVARAETSVSLIMVLLTLIWASLMGAFGWVIKILRDQADPGKTAEALGRALEASSLNSSIRQLSDAMKEVKRLAVKSEAGSEPPPSQSAGAS